MMEAKPTKEKILCTIGRKIGDSLWALVNAKQLSKLYRTQIDFMTSAYCAPLITLIKYQSFIDHVIINDDMTKQVEEEHPDLPWVYRGKEIKGWNRQYHFGFERFPDQHIAHYFTFGQYQLPEPPWSLEYPDWKISDSKYFVLVPSIRYRNDEVYSEVVRELPYKTYILGNASEALTAVRSDTIQLGGVMDYLQTAAILARAEAVISPLTSNAVLGSLVGANLVIPWSGVEALRIFGVQTDRVNYVAKPNPDSDIGPSARDIVKAAMLFL